MYVNITYWEPEEDENDGNYKTIPCVLEVETYEAILSKQPPNFIQLLVDDGDILIINKRDLSKIRINKENKA